MDQSTDQIVNSKISEVDFLKEKSEQAKKQLTQSLSRAKAAISAKLSPGEIAKRHPILVIGSAAVAGFAAAAMAIPSKREQEIRQLERIKAAMTPPSADGTAKQGSAAKPVEKASLMMIVIKEVIALIRPLLMTAITAGIKAGVNPPVEPASPPQSDANGF